MRVGEVKTLSLVTQPTCLNFFLTKASSLLPCTILCNPKSISEHASPSQEVLRVVTLTK